MTASDYKVILEKAKKDLFDAKEELGKCQQRQEDLDKRITGLRQTITALSRMLGEEFVEEDAIGLTATIRQIFKTNLGTFIPTEIRDRLEECGYDIKRYGNFMASIHSVINRLLERKEIVEAGTRGDGKTAYKWNGPIEAQVVAPRGTGVRRSLMPPRTKDKK